MAWILRRFFALAMLICCMFSLFPATLAAESGTREDDPPAEDISSEEILIECEGIYDYCFFDGYTIYGAQSYGDVRFTLAHEKGIGSLYIVFQYEYGPYQIVNNDTGEEATVGHARYLHDFVDLEALFGSAPSSVTVKMESGTVWINEVSVYTPGRVPEDVQIWEAPKDGETDLILFSAHADDEHLFFAGLLPYYGAELGYQVQVVYLTDHRSYTTVRLHELLDGLWAVGIRSYPVVGKLKDFNVRSLWGTYEQYAALGYSQDRIQEFVVEQLRRFKPKVVVTHDFKGEYGHGMHMVIADALAKALESSNDPARYPSLTEKYGVWDVPKAYFHLYSENPIVLDWDQPLESFNGMTAYEVSLNLGFQKHQSQVKDYLWYYAGCSEAKSIPRYSPCEFGLYRSTVGEDVEKNDFFENVTTYAQDRQAELDRIAEEARLKAEEEARQVEEQRKKEAEKQKAEAEKKARQEAEQYQREQEKAARLAAEKDAEKKQQIIIAGIVLIIAVFVVISWVFCNKKLCEKSRKNL